MPASGVEPDKLCRQIDKGNSLLAAHLQGCGGAEGHCFRPQLGHVAATADLSDGALAEFARRRKIEAHHAIVVAVRRIERSMLNAYDRSRFKTGNITAPVDLFDHFSQHG